MSLPGRRGRNVSRRAALILPFFSAPALLRAQGGSKGAVLEANWGKYPDPATEFEVIRLSSSDYETWMPPIPSRAVNRRSSEVLVASTRSGSMQLHRIDLGNGRWRQLTEARQLDRQAATWSADDRTVFYVDGGRLFGASAGTLREQELFAPAEGAAVAGPLAPTQDGTAIFFATAEEGKRKLWRMRLPKAPPELVTEETAGVESPSPNPRRATVLWLNGAGECWIAAFDGTGKRKVEAPPGRILQAFWSPDGRELLYLLDPGVAGEQVQIRTHDIDSRGDQLVAKTSQFARFAPNANATVFLGASRSKASPAMLLMLRVTRRELTLCEHQASEPGITAPRFTLNSQRILFESDRHGKPAVYSMNVERLVEKTDS